MNTNKEKDLIRRAKEVSNLLQIGDPSELDLEAAECLADLVDLISDKVNPSMCNPNQQPAEPWSVETMRMINKLTPEIKGRAFDPDWFLLRQRLEDYDQLFKFWQALVKDEL